MVMLACSLGGAAEQTFDNEVAKTTVGSTGLTWQPAVAYDSAVLTVSGPGDSVLRREFAAGEALVFLVNDRDKAVIEDGEYTWEIRFAPSLDAEAKRALRAARETGDPADIERLKEKGAVPGEALVVSGYFRVKGGWIIDETTESSFRRSSGRVEAADSTGAVDVDSAVPTKDQVILDDLIVDGSICVGFDCVNGESFGFDTLRLKENNLRIKAQDTSNSASFPTNDWQLTFNDSANGGANKFSIDDIDGGRTPFTIEASAPSHSLYVDDGGRIGFGTSTPVVELHVKDGDTPTLRLEQDGSSGFTPQTWDVAGNETNFFIRDVTNGSTLPFRIRPGAPTSSIDIASSGMVGIGTSSPSGGKLHIRDTVADSTLLYFENTAGQAIFQMVNGFGDQWAYRAQNNGFGINNANNPGLEFRVAENGDIYVNAVMVHSSRELKENFTDVSPHGLLEKVSALPIMEWNYRGDSPVQRHIGPVAEDFHSIFELNPDDTNVSLSDLSGIALSSIQALHAEARERDLTIEELTRENRELAERLAELEQLVRELSSVD
jgi:hypothetical protein